MQEPDPLLSSLCSICHIRPHQYCCPRCSTLTCSATCIKRHKQWASCNGTRDPTTYVPISKLATPSGIDHDYNYLTSIELGFDRAERDAKWRGITRQPHKKGPEKGEKALVAALEASEIMVARAPKGMSRSKSNRTKWLKGSKTLEWTVEWVHEDGKKEVGQFKDDLTMMDAYDSLYSAKDQQRKRKREGDKRSTQQEKKLHLDHPGPAGAETQGETASLPSPPKSPTNPGAAGEKNRQPSDICTDGGLSEPASESTKSTDQLSSTEKTDSRHNAPKIYGGDVAQPQPEKTDQNITSEPLSFYLHTPSLPCKQTVLAPITPETTISSALRTRLVLEYPTIYVFRRHFNDDLLEKYIREEDFYKMSNKERIEQLDEGEIVENLNYMDRRIEKIDDDVEPVIPRLDEKRLLEVLGKDLGGR